MANRRIEIFLENMQGGQFEAILLDYFYLDESPVYPICVKSDVKLSKSNSPGWVIAQHFGVLEGLRGGGDEVLNIMDLLREGGFVDDVERKWEGGDYRYPEPTERGWEILDEGRLFE